MGFSILQQLTLPERFKLIKYEEGECELRCDRTFLHTCRVCCEVTEDTNNLIAFLNPGIFFKNLPPVFIQGFFLKIIFLFPGRMGIHWRTHISITGRTNYSTFDTFEAREPMGRRLPQTADPGRVYDNL